MVGSEKRRLTLQPSLGTVEIDATFYGSDEPENLDSLDVPNVRFDAL